MFAVSACACVALLFLDPGFWTLLGGLSVATFAYGGYLAILPSLTADYFGPRHVGANYGFVFSAWGACGFLVPGYFAAIMDRARLAGDLAAGYHQIYWQLAVLAAAGAAVAALLRPPAGQAPPAR
jgi:OFA family oxalate/formate antiporter-like MFS transporter